jgi:hypothetical protein
MLVLSVIGTLLFSSHLAVADSRNYRPPAETGYIYTVILYKRTALRTETTSVSVRWGAYNRSGSVTPPQILPGRALSAKGFVLRLRHSKNDSVPLNLDTNGRITTGPYQGSPPAEWNNGDYRHIEW